MPVTLTYPPHAIPRCSDYRLSRYFERRPRLGGGEGINTRLALIK
ncbi:hypothetical protein [Phormidium tenue]|nr:hypothetical protein [Phormidium tenue]